MMEMKRKSLTVTALIVMFLFSASLVMAQAGGQMKHHGATQGKEKSEKGGGAMMGSGGQGGMMGMMSKMMSGMSGMMSMMSSRGGCGMMSMMDMESKFQEHFALCLKNADKLGLTEEQIGQLKKIHNEQLKKLIMLKAEVKVIDVDLSAELEKDVPNLDRVEKLLKKQEELKTKYRLELVRAKVESSKILTKEQRKKLKTLMKGGMMGGMKGGKKGGMKGGMQGSSGGSMMKK